MFPVIDKKRTGKRIAFWMRIYELTPKDIQKYLSLSCVQTVYRWLDGTNIPTIDNLYALTRLFRVRLDAIVVGDETENGGISPLLQHAYAYWTLYESKMLKVQ